MLVEKRSIAGNCEISYLDSGQPESPRIPLLFLHGWGLSAGTFRTGLEIISRSRRVIAPDIPGFGKSACRSDLRGYEDYASALRDFLDCLKIEKVDLAGQSLGGGIALVMSSAYLGRVRSLTLIDSTGIPLGSFSQLLAHRFQELPAQAWETRLSPYHLGMLGAFSRNLAFSIRNTVRAVRLPLSVDLTGYMNTVSCPCLILWGEKDLTIPLDKGRKISTQIQDSRLQVVRGSHHEWSALKPEIFADYVLGFLSSLEK